MGQLGLDSLGIPYFHDNYPPEVVPIRTGASDRNVVLVDRLLWVTLDVEGIETNSDFPA